jgi:hypothetical protein
MRTVPLLFLAASLAACGAEAPSASSIDLPSFEAPAATAASSAPMPRACALVSAEQAAMVLGQTASPMSDDAEACVYASSEHPGSITLLTLILSDSGDVATAREVFNGIAGLHGNLNGMINQAVGTKSNKSGQELDDLGDEAWLSGGNVDLVATRQLVVRKGSRILTLNVTGMGDSSGVAGRMQAVARNAVAAL